MTEMSYSKDMAKFIDKHVYATTSDGSPKKHREQNRSSPSHEAYKIQHRTGLDHNTAAKIIRWILHVVLFLRPGKYDTDYVREGRHEYFGGALRRIVMFISTLIARKEAISRKPGKK